MVSGGEVFRIVLDGGAQGAIFRGEAVALAKKKECIGNGFRVDGSGERAAGGVVPGCDEEKEFHDAGNGGRWEESGGGWDPAGIGGFQPAFFMAFISSASDQRARLTLVF